MEERSEKQHEYLARSGATVLDQESIDHGGWMLVSLRPPIELVADVAVIEATTGETIRYADSSVWVDRDGREHYGPGETGYDRYEIA